MAEKASIEVVAVRYAGDDGFMVQDAPAADRGEDDERHVILLGQLGDLRPLNLKNELAAHAPGARGAATVDEALAVRRTIAGRR